MLFHRFGYRLQQARETYSEIFEIVEFVNKL